MSCRGWPSRGDLHALRRAAAEVPGYVENETGLAVVSLSGVADGLDLGEDDVVWGPTDIVAAWR